MMLSGSRLWKLIPASSLVKDSDLKQRRFNLSVHISRHFVCTPESLLLLSLQPQCILGLLLQLLRRRLNYFYATLQEMNTRIAINRKHIGCV